jgi:UDP-2,4-diacetamido-2,4,6-trideoxy-beta-L-altropyranose hydrolase
MIYIRADANDKIGIGHMMRCFAIAKALRRRGTEATFFVADKSSAKMAAEAGFGYVCLGTDYDHMDQEADRLLQHMQERNVDHLLVDSYFVTEHYMNRIRELARLAYLDDVNRFLYPCDLLINYNIYAESLRYPERYQAAGLATDFALGLSYMPLRDGYLSLEREPHEGFRILLTTGATDRLGVVEAFLAAFTDSDLAGKTEVYAILGRYHEHREELRAKYGTVPGVHLLDPQPDLRALIASCDIAVTAGGTTVYELCAGGLPAVLLTIADNQMMAAQEFNRRGLIPYAGDVRTDMEGTVERVLAEIRRAYENPEKLQEKSRQLRTVIDGRGADRIAKALLAMR